MSKQLVTDLVGATPAHTIANLLKLYREGSLPTLAPLLPILFNLDGKPYSLKHHFQYEAMFNTHRPNKLLLCTARQVAKTTFEAVDSVLKSVCIPNFKTLFIAPLFEQTRRISTDRVRAFIDQSPLKRMFVNSTTSNSVLKKTFTNNSVMHFSYALLNADRNRGLSADELKFDELQDMDRRHLPVIYECLSHSPWKLIQMAGTPKTPENTIHQQWIQSSQAEWFTKCESCNHYNIASTDFDLHKMIGDSCTPTPGEPFFGTICAKCSRTIDPSRGFWKHRYASRRQSFAGYHIPQPIMPIHYADPKAWAQLLAKRAGRNNYTNVTYLNEALGQTCGKGSQIVTQAELKAAAVLPWKNDQKNFRKSLTYIDSYELRVLAVDWGGGGLDEISLTALSVCGILPTGEIHVIWACKLHTPHDHLLEARTCMEVYSAFKCHRMAHDYNGAGQLRETVFIHYNRYFLEQLMPMTYVGGINKKLIRFVPASELHPRDHFQLDKTRSLLTVCNAIRTGIIKFFAYDYEDADNPGLIEEFLGLIENKTATRRAGDIYSIIRHSQLSDDFAQSVNLGCCALWHITGKWPTFSHILNGEELNLNDGQIHAMTPVSDEAWFEQDEEPGNW